MHITTLNFFIFASLTVLIYYALPRRPQNMLLLGASYLFYAWWSPLYVLVLLGLTALYDIVPSTQDALAGTR